MKLKHIAAAFTLLSLPAFGANIVVTSKLGPINTHSIVDNAGNAVDGGYAAFGLLDVAGLGVPSTGQDIADALTVFDGGFGVIDSQFGGSFSISGGGNTNLGDGTNQFSGEAIYLVLGNGADLPNSSQAAIVDLQSVFGDSEPANATINLRWDQVDPGQLLWGEFGVHTGNRDNPALTLVPIPEPSSSLLFGLAGLALLIRRKR